MGYGYYEITTPSSLRPIKRGYAVPDKCNHRGCRERIDRGMAYLCYGCTWYFCARHLYYSGIDVECFAGTSTVLCKKCLGIISRREKRNRAEALAAGQERG